MTYELLEIELFDHLTVCQKMNDAYSNCKWYISMLGTIYLWLRQNLIVRKRTDHLPVCI